MLVEDVEEFSKKLESLGAEHYIDQGQQGHQAGYFEKKFYGPEHVLFDIAEHGWAGAEPLPEAVKGSAPSKEDTHHGKAAPYRDRLQRPRRDGRFLHEGVRLQDRAHE